MSKVLEISLDAEELNLEVPQGADVQLLVNYKPNGVQADLTTFTARMKVKPDFDLAEILSLTSGASEIILAATSPNITVKFPNAKTTAMTTYGGVYDLEIISAGALVTRVLKGKFVLAREVTT